MIPRVDAHADERSHRLRFLSTDRAAMAHIMARKIFVNLPVRDLDKSIRFFTALGYAFNPRFTDETATCMIVSDSIFVMLLTEEKFRTFTNKPVSDATKSTEVLLCLSCESRGEVDEQVREALAAGGTSPMQAKDYGFMYAHGYTDLDGHVWELIYMDENGVDQG